MLLLKFISLGPETGVQGDYFVNKVQFIPSKLYHTSLKKDLYENGVT